MFYHVAQANEYLVITGVGIEDVKVVKKAWVWPGQNLSRFNLTPNSYEISLHAMSIEKLEFKIPAVFTIGPEDKLESLCKYARLLTIDSRNLEELVLGIVEGETRVIAASLTIEEIFKDRKLFKEHVLKGIQAELDQFGMVIYNANVKQLQDTPGSEYFKYLRLKSQEGAINKAKVDVARARMLGTVGEKEREGETRKQTSKIEAETMVFEQQKQIEISKANTEVQTMDTQFQTSITLASIEAEKKAKLRDAELQEAIEIERAKVAQEKERAEKMSKITVEAEIMETIADAEFYKAKALADAKLFKEMKEAEAEKIQLEAQAEGIKLLQRAFNGDNSATLGYLMLEQGLHAELAQVNANAIEGLAPKITVWNTDGASKGTIQELMQALPPVISTIQSQTGIKPPKWMADVGDSK